MTIEQSESVAPMASPQTPHPLRGDLPYAPALPEPYLRKARPLRGWVTSIVVNGGGVGAAIGLAAVMSEPLIFAAFTVIPAAWFLLRVRAYNIAATPALRKLNQGHLDDAAVTFAELAHGYSDSVHLRSVSMHNLGLVEQRRGNHERAIALFQAAWLAKGMKRVTHRALHDTMPMYIALHYALLGDVAAAHAWLDAGRKRRRSKIVHYDVWVEAVILARSHREADAARLMDESWREIEGTTTGTGMRPIRVVRAFLHAQSRDAPARLSGFVEGAKPFSPGEYAWLGSQWPEMRAFLLEHELA